MKNMKTIGFVISKKENEKRRALIPNDLVHIKNTKFLYFEKGYGEVLGYTDDDYKKYGVNIASTEEIYSKDIICNLKTPELSELKYLKDNQILFGWIHAVQNKKFTDFLVNHKMTAIAWEKMNKNGRHVFWRNNEIAGESAILHALLYYGRFLYGCNVAVLGRGNTARGAMRILEKIGAKCITYDRKTIKNLREHLGNYDIIVNTVMWNVFRKDRIIYKEDLKLMKPHSMIIDVSCNTNMEIETSRPTTIENPIYWVDGIMHYSVDHSPALIWKSATESISSQLIKYIDYLIEENSNNVIDNAIIIKNGEILDDDIKKFQNRH